jgi:hypothetical protein
MSSPTSGIGKSGNLTATARTVGRDARRARAIARATEVAPIVAEIQAAGVTSLHGIARALNYARCSNSDRSWHMGSAAGEPRARAAQVVRRSGTDHRSRWLHVA